MNTTTAPVVTQSVVSAPAIKDAPRGTKANLIRKHLGLLGMDAPLKDVALAVVLDAKAQGFELACSVQDISTNKQNSKPKDKEENASSGALSFAEGMEALTTIGKLGGLLATANLLKNVEPLLEITKDVHKFRKMVLNIAQMQGAKDALAILEPVDAPPVG